MPTQFDNMSVDENPAPPALSAAQNNFINAVRFGGDLLGALGDLIREMPSRDRCVNLNRFIEHNLPRPDYLERFTNCVGGDPQAIRFSLHNFATRAGFNGIEEYFASEPQHNVASKLGLGVHSDNNPVSDLGERIRKALRRVGAEGEYNLFFISFLHFHRFILCTYSYFNYTNSIFSTRNPTGGALYPPTT